MHISGRNGTFILSEMNPIVGNKNLVETKAH